MKVYVFLLEGEPLYVTQDLNRIRKECEEYYRSRPISMWEDDEFSYWCKDHEDEYKDADPDHEDVGMTMWRRFLNEQFEEGTWGDYAWYECYMK